MKVIKAHLETLQNKLAKTESENLEVRDWKIQMPILKENEAALVDAKLRLEAELKTYK